MQKHFILLIALVIVSAISLRGQHTIINRQGAVFYTPAEMKQISDRMLNLMDQTVAGEENTDSIYMYHIVYTELWSGKLQTGQNWKLSKEDFREDRFEKNVLWNLRTQKSRLTSCVMTVFLNKNKEMIGGGYCEVNGPICKAQHYDRYLPVALEMNKHKFKTAFEICFLFTLPPPFIYFAIDENNRYYVIHSMDGFSYNVSRLNDFVEQYWNEYFPKGITD